MYGNPETTTGGRALKFYSSVRLDIRRTESIKQGGEVIGNHTRIKVVKNKVAPPFKEAEFDIVFGKGISRTADILELATNAGIILKSGAWFSYNDEKIGQGRENTKAWLDEHPDILADVERMTREHFGLPTTGAAPAATEPQEEEKPKKRSAKKADPDSDALIIDETDD